MDSDHEKHTHTLDDNNKGSSKSSKQELQQRAQPQQEQGAVLLSRPSVFDGMMITTLCLLTGSIFCIRNGWPGKKLGLGFSGDCSCSTSIFTPSMHCYYYDDVFFYDHDDDYYNYICDFYNNCCYYCCCCYYDCCCYCYCCCYC